MASCWAGMFLIEHSIVLRLEVLQVLGDFAKRAVNDTDAGHKKGRLRIFSRGISLFPLQMSRKNNTPASRDKLNIPQRPTIIDSTRNGLFQFTPFYTIIISEAARPRS